MTRGAGLASVDEIRAVLERGSFARDAGHGRIARIARRDSAYASSSAMEALEIEFEDQFRLPVIFKNLSPAALLSEARRVRPEFLYDPVREIEVYRKLLARWDLGTARCYATHADATAGRYWLFLENVSGRELYQVGEFAVWEAAAGWLARFHRLTAGQPVAASELRLQTWDESEYRRCLEWVRTVLESHRSGIGSRRRWGPVLDLYERWLVRMAQWPGCVIHGEFFAANVLIGLTPAGVRVCPVDWETAGQGTGMMDLAALVAGGWSDGQREALALAYWHELDAAGRAEWGSRSAMSEALTACRFHIAMRMIGQLPGWEPPLAQRHDWLAEAEQLAAALGG